MANTPISVGSGKPTISRVPEGGGGAFRPRPVAAAAAARPSLGEALERVTQAESPAPAAVTQAPPQAAGDEALWRRLEALKGQRLQIARRVESWARVSEKNHG